MSKNEEKWQNTKESKNTRKNESAYKTDSKDTYIHTRARGGKKNILLPSPTLKRNGINGINGMSLDMTGFQRSEKWVKNTRRKKMG